MQKSHPVEPDMNAILLQFLAERGVDLEALRDHPIAKSVFHPAARGYNEPEWHNVMAVLAELSGDQALALHLGQHVHLADIGVFGYALMSCEDLRDVIGMMMLYHPIANKMVKWQFLARDTGYVLRATLGNATALKHRMVMETAFAMVYSMGSSLIQDRVTTARLHLDYPRPSYAEEYDDIFAIPVQFDQDHCELFLPDSLLARKVQTANPSGRVVFRQQCEGMLQEMKQADGLAVSVRRHLLQASGNFPDIADVAVEFHMSERSLRRRLAAERTSYREILDDVRHVLARQYLSETSITVTEISWLLDYTEPSSFRRAFHRWNGQSPDAYRRSNQA